MKNLVFLDKTACLITDNLTRSYLTDTSVDEGYLIIAGGKTCCFTDARYFAQAKPQLEKKGIQAKLFTDLSDIKEYLIGLGVIELKIDFSRTTVKEYNEYLGFGLKITDCEEQLSVARSIKTDAEIELIKTACDIAQKAYYQAMATVKAGISEKQLKECIENNICRLGGDGPSFETIVAFGANAAVPHHTTGDTVLRDNQAILVDMGAKYKGYCSDLTRTAFFGTPDKKFLDAYDAVLNSNLIAVSSIKSGDLTDHADGYARNYLSARGYKEKFTHSLGHGVGLEIHEYPTLSPKRKQVLHKNMTFTIEPGVYFDGEFGIRIEDTVLLTEKGVQRLFTDDKALKIYG